MHGFEDPYDDLDRLVSELNLITPASGRSPVTTTGAIEAWLGRVREADGSDLLLVAGAPPVMRTNGRLVRLSDEPLSSEEIEGAVLPVVAPRLQERFRAGEAVDLAFKVTGLGRFRMNVHRERGRAAAAIRALPMRIPRLADLRFSHDISPLGTLPRGLVLIGGPTGSGKTTTMASLIASINEREARHIITVEDPIEYDHPHGRSVIEQVEIGIDARDFPTALRAAVRQAPDVIVVGEMRDPETMRIALQAAETGHLVFATVHTTDVAAAISRIADGFPSERQNAVGQELAMALAAVLTQTLVPARTGGIVPVAELLMVSYGARQHIRKNALQHLNQEMTITRKAGSFTFEESLARGVQAGLLDRHDAMLRAAHPDELESILAPTAGEGQRFLMQIGLIGLGRMGGNMARRLMAGGHEVAAWDRSADAVRTLAGGGATGAASLDDLVARLHAPRAVWVMVPAGDPTEQTVAALADRLQPDDIVIDGGNTYYKDDVRRARTLREKGIHYVDVGTSGGVWGAERGYCLMIGGAAAAVERLTPILRTLAPGEGAVPATRGLDRTATTHEGFVHCGPPGAGHFVKMIHNGIEYGLMQWYAEGFDILRNASSEALPEEHRFTFDLADIAEVWRRGSVVSSWLLDLAGIALREDPTLAAFEGRVADSGEGRWTVAAAIEESVPADVLTTALYTRFRSRRDHTFAEKLLSALRAQFGGHVEPR